jgi:hypothetical protein
MSGLRDRVRRQVRGAGTTGGGHVRATRRQLLKGAAALAGGGLPASLSAGGHWGGYTARNVADGRAYYVPR